LPSRSSPFSGEKRLKSETSKIKPCWIGAEYKTKNKTKRKKKPNKAKRGDMNYQKVGILERVASKGLLEKVI
jgi:hypothetical protein